MRDYQGLCFLCYNRDVEFSTFLNCQHWMRLCVLSRQHHKVLGFCVVWCLLGCYGAECKEISESAPRVLLTMLSEIGVLSGVLPGVLLMALCEGNNRKSTLNNTLMSTPDSLHRAPSRALLGALPRAPRFLRALSSALGEHFRRFPCSRPPLV